MKICLKNSQWVELFNAIESMGTVQGKAKFTYALAKNRSILKPHIEAIQEAANAFQKTDRFKAYQAKNEDMLREFGVKDDGSPNVRESEGGRLNRVVPVAKQGAFVTAQEKLREEFKDLFEMMELSGKDLELILKEEITLDVRAVKFNDLPTDIPQRFMNAFFELVVEEDAVPAGETVH
jgi:hypothetical protein